jgi:hypothetical protein
MTEVAEDEHASVPGSRVGAKKLQLPDLGREGTPAKSSNRSGREFIGTSSCIPEYSDSSTKVPSSSSASQSTSSIDPDGLCGGVP